MATVPESRSVGELVRDLANDVTNLVRQELNLARTEAQDKLHQTIAKPNGLKPQSMGKSPDIQTAIRYGATHVRVG